MNAAQSSTPAGAVANLEAIYRDHYRLVLRAAHRITGNAQDAEDVLQTVFMRLARREGGSPLSDSPSSYLHRAAVNAALDIIRSRQSAKASPLDEVEANLATTSGGPDEAQAGREIREHLRGAMSQLSPKAAEIFALRYFEGYGNHEIARMLGTSRSTVNVILHRSRQRMKDSVREFLGEGR